MINIRDQVTLLVTKLFSFTSWQRHGPDIPQIPLFPVFFERLNWIQGNLPFNYMGFSILMTLKEAFLSY